MARVSGDDCECDCPECKGTGVKLCLRCHGSGRYYFFFDCPTCSRRKRWKVTNTDGHVDCFECGGNRHDKNCEACHGTGHIGHRPFTYAAVQSLPLVENSFEIGSHAYGAVKSLCVLSWADTQKWISWLGGTKYIIGNHFTLRESGRVFYEVYRVAENQYVMLKTVYGDAGYYEEGYSEDYGRGVGKATASSTITSHPPPLPPGV
jgi:hypothetical protein